MTGMRRFLLPVVVWAVLSSTEAQDIPFRTAPFLQRLETDGITIMWELEQPVDCVVEFGLSTSYGSTRDAVESTGKKDRTGAGGTSLYACTLNGLEAGKTYHYRVVTGTAKTGDRTFSTAPLEHVDFSFAVWGDSQEAGVLIGGHNQPMHAMLTDMKRAKVAFAVAVGDLSPNGRFYEGVRACVLDSVCTLLGPSTPVMIAWGNHDGKPRELIRSYLPANNGTYSFDYAGCHFLVVDWQDRDYAFMEQDLKTAQSNKSRHTFVFCHHPPAEKESISAEYLVKLVPLLKKYEASMAFCGHWHRYEKMEHAGIPFYVTGGGLMASEPNPHYLRVHVNANGVGVEKIDFFEQ